MTDFSDPLSDDEARHLMDRLNSYESRAQAAQSKAAQAYMRLLVLAETRDSGQIEVIAKFLAMTYNWRAYKWDPIDLRSLDVEISDDMLACLDALRWGKTDLFSLVPNGESRVSQVIENWGLRI